MEVVAPEVLLAATIVTCGLALLFDFTNGFHDAANATATVIASQSLAPLPVIPQYHHSNPTAGHLISRCVCRRRFHAPP